MAALSARLANMGFMKRAAAAQSGQRGVQQQADRTAEPLQQSASAQQQHAAEQCIQDAQLRARESSNSSHEQPFAEHSIPRSTQQQQPEQSQHATGRRKLSDNITNMQFMKRAQLKRSREEAFDAEQAAKDAAEWVSARAVQDKGCLIIHERDPLPTGVSGRMSFGFGHMYELEQAEAAERELVKEREAREAQIEQEAAGGYGFGAGKGWSPAMMRTKDETRRQAKKQRR